MYDTYTPSSKPSSQTHFVTHDPTDLSCFAGYGMHGTNAYRVEWGCGEWAEDEDLMDPDPHEFDSHCDKEWGMCSTQHPMCRARSHTKIHATHTKYTNAHNRR